jgi:hypothetical protein
MSGWRVRIRWASLRSAPTYSEAVDRTGQAGNAGWAEVRSPTLRCRREEVVSSTCWASPRSAPTYSEAVARTGQADNVGWAEVRSPTLRRGCQAGVSRTRWALLRSVPTYARPSPKLPRTPLRVFLQLHDGGFRKAVVPAQVLAVDQYPQVAESQQQSGRHRDQEA